VSGGGPSHRRLRLFLDSNVLTGGIVARWGLDKAVLSLCAARICRLVLAEAVREEVELNLLRHAVVLKREGEMLDDYTTLIRLARPEVVSYPDEPDVLAARHLIAHEADVPILLSAIQAKPDWLLTHNRKHFTAQVAKRSGLQIGTPADFFRALSQGLS
jgi:predicted nucleic acid-binding protein